MNLIAMLSGIVSDLPEAVAFFEKLSPYLTAAEGLLPPAVQAELTAAAPAVHDAVSLYHDAIATVVAARTALPGAPAAPPAA